MTSKHLEYKNMEIFLKKLYLGRLCQGELNDLENFTRPLEEENIIKLINNSEHYHNYDNEESLNIVNLFYDTYFCSPDSRNIEKLYDEIKLNGEIRLPLFNFEEKYLKIKKNVLNGSPEHCTVDISLWGLQFQYPEDELSNDLMAALVLLEKSQKNIHPYQNETLTYAKENREDLVIHVRDCKFLSRSIILTCFNLMESYLNGLAWKYVNHNENYEKLSNTKKRKLKDTTFKNKLICYPEIISAKPFKKESEEPVKGFLHDIKPLRDSIVHASPFRAEERFDDYDKLEKLYKINPNKARKVFKKTIILISEINNHIYGATTNISPWLEKLKIYCDSLDK